MWDFAVIQANHEMDLEAALGAAALGMPGTAGDIAPA